MASDKILAKKQEVINEIKNCFLENVTTVVFNYRGLTDNEAKQLKRELRKNESDFKVYKNTLMSRALNDLNINIDNSLVGPSALAYGKDQIAPIRTLAEFAKKHKALELKVGLVDGEVSDKLVLDALAKLPSRNGLLTMLAGSMIGLVKDLSICLDLYSKEKN